MSNTKNRPCSQVGLNKLLCAICYHIVMITPSPLPTNKLYEWLITKAGVYAYNDNGNGNSNLSGCKHEVAGFCHYDNACSEKIELIDGDYGCEASL